MRSYGRHGLVYYKHGDNFLVSHERDGIEKQILRVYIHEEGKTGDLRLGANEFNALVNRLPMATVCSEARLHAMQYCLEQVPIVHMWYADDPTEQEMKLGQRLQPGIKITEPIPVQHGAVMLSLGYLQRLNDDRWERFESAHDLVETVGRVFGPSIERIVLDSWCGSDDVFSDIYWEHTAQTLQSQSMCVLHPAQPRLITFQLTPHTVSPNLYTTRATTRSLHT